jgi:hypothetical protein
MVAVVVVATGAVVGGSTPAFAIGDGWQDPVSLGSPAASWLASGCNGNTAYTSGLYHIGRDYLNPVGTEVKAIADGTVSLVASFGDGLATAVFVKHQSADGAKFLALYGHVNTSVQAGNVVHKGDVIATVADIVGSDSHLHFGLYPSWDGLPSSGWGRMACTGTGDGIGGTNGFVDPVAYLNAHPRVNPDADGDGVPDAQDACPHVYVANSTGCPAKGDFSLDGKSEVAAFYRYDGGAVNLWLWNGQSNLYTSGPYVPWSASTGWDASRLIPAGVGDFNGDKTQDTAAFYAYDNGALGLDVWYGNTQAGLTMHQGWYVGSAWEGARVIAAGAGDFNGDGRADVAAFYRYDGNLVNLYVWYGQSNGDFAGPYTVWTGNGWDGTRIITVGVGDTDADGHADISTFYRHDGGMMDQNVWYGDGTGNFTLGRPWHVDTSWDGSRFIPAGVADLNRDGKMDTICWYRQDGGQVDMRVWYGTSSRIGGEPGGPWSGFNGWDGYRMIPAGTGDYNGDGKMDVSAFYRYDGQVVGLNIWYGDGGGNLSLVQGWYDSTSGWEGARVIPAAKG